MTHKNKNKGIIDYNFLNSVIIGFLLKIWSYWELNPGPRAC